MLSKITKISNIFLLCLKREEGRRASDQKEKEKKKLVNIASLTQSVSIELDDEISLVLIDESLTTCKSTLFRFFNIKCLICLRSNILDVSGLICLDSRSINH